ncbi:hypothetical protein SAMN05216548_108112 [Faunimonas pinastri]|uniref:Uncharacterized protein n=1 Tax=Faunimonas pinastri TaxID=1855383 RepID=A0A1H9JFP9_9HYPH|nr:hypothetical protein SAMN05216548_108112 [Faunimonas pinastri]
MNSFDRDLGESSLSSTSQQIIMLQRSMRRDETLVRQRRHRRLRRRMVSMTFTLLMIIPISYGVARALDEAQTARSLLENVSDQLSRAFDR